MMRNITAALSAIMAMFMLTLPAPARAEVKLLMVEQPGCRYCIEWDNEIGPIYPKSQEGQFAPLRRVQREDPALKAFKPVIYTPTFLVVRDGVEVGRVTGYAGKIFFWEELNEELNKAGFRREPLVPELDKTKARPQHPAGTQTQVWRESRAEY